MATQLTLAVDLEQVVQDAAMRYFDPSSDVSLKQQLQVWLAVFQAAFGRDPDGDDDLLWDYLFDPKGLNVLHRFYQSEQGE